MRHAPILLRLVAYVLDVAVLLAVAWLAYQFLPKLLGLHPLLAQSGWRIELYVLLFVSVPSWIYFAAAESSPAQATIGKLAMGLVVTDDDGARISFPRALRRTLIKLVPWEATHITVLLPTPVFVEGAMGFRLGFMMVYGIALLYLGFALWSSDNQSIHDMMTDTCVLRRPPPREEPLSASEAVEEAMREHLG